MGREDKLGILLSLDKLLQSNRSTSLVYSGLVKILEGISEKIQPKISQVAINCPDDLQLINAIIDAASQVGAGNTWDSYHRVAMVVRDGMETFTPTAGANPNIGTIGVREEVKSARIFMQVPSKLTDPVVDAIRKVHPYENPVIEVYYLPHQQRRNEKTIR